MSQPQRKMQQKAIELDPLEQKMALSYAQSKDALEKQIGRTFLSCLTLAHRYGESMMQEQSFLKSLLAKHELPEDSHLHFTAEGVTATYAELVEPAEVESAESSG